jgi:hypothetical protein
MTKVWLKNEKGREGGGYMERLLGDLKERLTRDILRAESPADQQVAVEELIDTIRRELIRSFKNGLMKAREGAQPKGGVDERRKGYKLKS